jgi:hypothetical protein
MKVHNTATEGTFEQCLEFYFTHYRALFENEKNPLYAWKVYRMCRRNNVPLPWWVLDYFDKVAEGLLNPQRPKLPNERTGVFIQKALKMNKKGKGDIFRRFFENKKRINAVWHVLILLRDNKGMSPEDALLQGSENLEMPYETLRDWYYRYSR